MGNPPFVMSQHGVCMRHSPPYLTLSVDANVQRVGLTLGAVYDCGRALRVEVVALRQAVERAGLDATWFTQNTHRQGTPLSKVQPAQRTQAT